jgi:thiol:disulfide interchange protein
MIGRSLAASNPVRALAGRIGGVLSFAIGIVSIILGLIPCINVLAVLTSLVGLAIGVLAYRQSRLAFAPTRYAVFGIIFSAIAFFVSIGVSRSLYDKYYKQEGKSAPAEHGKGADW